MADMKINHVLLLLKGTFILFIPLKLVLLKGGGALDYTSPTDYKHRVMESTNNGQLVSRPLTSSFAISSQMLGDDLGGKQIKKFEINFLLSLF